MHHKEIGQFVGILEKYLAKESEVCAVRIEKVGKNHHKNGHCEVITTGIKLVAGFGCSQIKIQVDSPNQDSNHVQIFYFAPMPDDRPSLLLSSEPQSLNFTQIESMIQILVEVAKGNMCLRTIRAVGAIGDFKVMDIPIPEPIAA
jgi:hypothetical protein